MESYITASRVKIWVCHPTPSRNQLPPGRRAHLQPHVAPLLNTRRRCIPGGCQAGTCGKRFRVETPRAARSARACRSTVGLESHLASRIGGSGSGSRREGAWRRDGSRSGGGGRRAGGAARRRGGRPRRRRGRPHRPLPPGTHVFRRRGLSRSLPADVGSSLRVGFIAD